MKEVTLRKKKKKKKIMEQLLKKEEEDGITHTRVTVHFAIGFKCSRREVSTILNCCYIQFSFRNRSGPCTRMRVREQVREEMENTYFMEVTFPVVLTVDRVRHVAGLSAK